jgi:hypothetical protein
LLGGAACALYESKRFAPARGQRLGFGERCFEHSRALFGGLGAASLCRGNGGQADGVGFGQSAFCRGDLCFTLFERTSRLRQARCLRAARVPFCSRQALPSGADARVSFGQRNFTPEQVLQRPQPRSISAILERLALSQGARFVARGNGGKNRGHRDTPAFKRRQNEAMQMIPRFIEVLDHGTQAVAPPPAPGVKHAVLPTLSTGDGFGVC